MTYATVADLKAEVPPRDLQLLTDWDGVADFAEDARLLSALEDATAIVNGWIVKRVTLPLANPPRMLKVVTRDLALHRLYANRGTIPDAVKALHEGAMAYLKDVSRGDVSLGDEVPADTTEASPGAVLDEGGPPVFTRDTLKGF